MKFFKNRKFVALLLFGWLPLLHLGAQTATSEPMQDFMRQTGKIYVVVAVIVLIFLGLVVWLWRLDSKLTKIEHQIFQNNER